MLDLKYLNERLMQFARNGESLGCDVEYAGHLVVCAAVPDGKVEAWQSLLNSSTSPIRLNHASITNINRVYLTYARRVGASVRVGWTTGLLVMRMPYEMALFCAGLSDADIGKMSERWAGPIFKISTEITSKSRNLHPRAMGMHATSMIGRVR